MFEQIDVTELNFHNWGNDRLFDFVDENLDIFSIMSNK